MHVSGPLAAFGTYHLEFPSFNIKIYPNIPHSHNPSNSASLDNSRSGDKHTRDEQQKHVATNNTARSSASAPLASAALLHGRSRHTVLLRGIAKGYFGRRYAITQPTRAKSVAKAPHPSPNSNMRNQGTTTPKPGTTRPSRSSPSRT